MNAELGRKVLDYVTAHRDQFDMNVFGEHVPACGTTACLAGWALLLSGYQITGFDLFARPDGTEVSGETLSREAGWLLGIPAEEFDADGECPLFYVEDDDEAIERFRALVEAAEQLGREAGADL